MSITITQALPEDKETLRSLPKNAASARFWNRVIAEYTGGAYELAENDPNPECDYDDGTKASLIFFDNRR